MATKYTNSKLVSETYASPHFDDRKGQKITKITVHHAAGKASLSTLGRIFTVNQASANYGIDNNGKIGMFVEEKNRAWTSSNAANDYAAVTIEVSNSTLGPDWKISDKAWNALVTLCVDICKRNGIKKLNYTGDSTGNLTRHNMFIATLCPGPYLQKRFPELAATVNAKLKGNDVVKPQEEPTTKDIFKVQLTDNFNTKTAANKAVTALKEKKHTGVVVAVDGYFKVQIGAYTVKANAEKMLNTLRSEKFDAEIVTKTGSVVVEPTKISYRVQPNDALSLIAQKYQTSVNKIVKDNKIQNPNMIYVNQVLTIYPGVK